MSDPLKRGKPRPAPGYRRIAITGVSLVIGVVLGLLLAGFFLTSYLVDQGVS